MLRLVAWSLVAVAAAGGFAVASGRYPEGPPASKTGAPAVAGKPAEPSCVQCHVTYDGMVEVPNLNLPGGGVEILDLPSEYDAGATYPLRVRVWSDSTAAFPMRRWGFQITAVNAGDGEGAGSFQTPHPDTVRIVAGTQAEFSSRRYAEHTDNGNRDGLGGPVEWGFSWIAPDPPAGTVRFFAAGNAANGNFGSDGDFIYTASATVLDHTTSARRGTWGGLKRRYR